MGQHLGNFQFTTGFIFCFIYGGKLLIEPRCVRTQCALTRFSGSFQVVSSGPASPDSSRFSGLLAPTAAASYHLRLRTGSSELWDGHTSLHDGPLGLGRAPQPWTASIGLRTGPLGLRTGSTPSGRADQPRDGLNSLDITPQPLCFTEAEVPYTSTEITFL